MKVERKFYWGKKIWQTFKILTIFTDFLFILTILKTNIYPFIYKYFTRVNYDSGRKLRALFCRIHNKVSFWLRVLWIHPRRTQAWHAVKDLTFLGLEGAADELDPGEDVDAAGEEHGEALDPHAAVAAGSGGCPVPLSPTLLNFQASSVTLRQ